VGKGAIGQRRSGDGRKPLVAHGVLPRERGQRRQPLRPEALHHGRAIADARLLLVALHKAGHRRRSREGAVERGAVHLQVDVREVVSGIATELALVLGIVGHRHSRAHGVEIRVRVRSHAADFRVLCLVKAQHVVERAVLHHEDDEVLDARIVNWISHVFCRALCRRARVTSTAMCVAMWDDT
jgi:hypothetical protein